MGRGCEGDAIAKCCGRLECRNWRAGTDRIARITWFGQCYGLLDPGWRAGGVSVGDGAGDIQEDRCCYPSFSSRRCRRRRRPLVVVVDSVGSKTRSGWLGSFLNDPHWPFRTLSCSISLPGIVACNKNCQITLPTAGRRLLEGPRPYYMLNCVLVSRVINNRGVRK